MSGNPGQGLLGQGGSFGAGTVNALGGAVNDLFSGFGDQAKASADLSEASEYTDAANLAAQNEQFTKESTAIKVAQESRQLTASMGRTTAEVAGAGLANSGSALDILRSSAQQGALTQAVTSQQGLITEAGYSEQSESFTTMANAATEAAAAANKAATGAFIGAGVSLAASIASLA